MYLGQNLKYLRNRAGYTQEELASLLRVNRSTLDNYETSEREPSYEKLIEIAKLFNVSIDDLLTKEIKPPLPLYVSNIKFLRKSHDLSQYDMGKMLGYRGKQGYGAIETGESRISVEALILLSDFFGVTLDQLVRQDLAKEE